MGIDSVRAALQIVTGAGELTRTKALEAAANLLAIPGVGPTAARATHAAGQVSTLADELVAAASANRDTVRDLVHQELEGQLQRLGLATTSELEALRDEVARLQHELAEHLAATTEGAAPPAGTPTAPRGTGRRTAGRTATKTTAPRTATKSAASSRARPAKKSTERATHHD